MSRRFFRFATRGVPAEDEAHHGLSLRLSGGGAKLGEFLVVDDRGLFQDEVLPRVQGQDRLLGVEEVRHALGHDVHGRVV